MQANRSFANHFLIAMPGMHDPNFARGVTLLFQHNDDGAMGIMINRRSDFTLGEIFAQMHIANESTDLAAQPVLLGGPVQPERGFVVHDDTREWGSSLRVHERLAVTTSRDILDAMARGKGPARALMALGYAGWGAGQLEAELAENAWLTVPADEAILFDTPIESRWQAAAGRIGVNMDRLTDYSGRA